MSCRFWQQPRASPHVWQLRKPAAGSPPISQVLYWSTLSEPNALLVNMARSLCSVIEELYMQMLLYSFYKEGVEKYFWKGDEECAVSYKHRVCGCRRIWQECTDTEKLFRTGCWVLMPPRLLPQRSNGIRCCYWDKGTDRILTVCKYVVNVWHG